MMNGHEWAVVSALLTVMTAEGTALGILYKNLMACNEARVAGLEKQLSMARTVSLELGPKPPEPEGGKPV